MAKAWHKRRARLELVQEAQVSCWKADKYRHNGNKWALYPVTEIGEEERVLFFSAGPDVTLEVSPGAVWRRFNPLDSYLPPKKQRQVEEAGPHLAFLRLKGIMEELKSKGSPEEQKRKLLFNALTLFANRYGLLGLFQEHYLPWPILPKGKRLIAPEAILDGQGRLQQVDPLTRGKELRWKKLDGHKKFAPEGYHTLYEDEEPEAIEKNSTTVR